MPFRRAAKELEHFTSVEVSEATVRRITEGAGAEYVAVQDEEVERILEQAPESPPGPELQLISADGAMVHETSGEWVEVRTAAIGEVETKGAGGEVHTRELSYFSRLSTASEFTRQALVEVFRRGTEKARRVCTVNDGADWEQKFIDYHRPDAVRILDFAHAAGKVAEAGRLIFGEDTPHFKQWFTKQKQALKLGKTKAVLRGIRRLETKVRGRDRQRKIGIIRGSASYLEKRREMIKYDEFQGKGYPIGSGSVESANKLVVESRLKQAGMRWARPNIDPMLALRNVACNDRWQEAWPQLITHRLEAMTKYRNNQPIIALPPERSSVTVAAPVISESSSMNLLRSSQSKSEEEPIIASSKRPYKPAADHPWRRKPFGRARYGTPVGFTRAKI
jgi:predicted DCC family thiol-disulfide oxidoreductase YuxK